MQDNTDTYLEILAQIISEQLPDCEIVLYGSRARKDFREGSDIDIAIRCDTKIDPVVLSKLRDDIDDSTVPVLIDVVDYYSVSDQMRSEIDKDGVVWKK